MLSFRDHRGDEIRLLSNSLLLLIVGALTRVVGVLVCLDTTALCLRV